MGKFEEGRPAYPIGCLVKLYIYGYLNGVRSSRKLEREALTNVEAMWLLGGLCPKYKTISNFRKDNSEGFKNLFKFFREFCKQMELYGREVVAIDGSKFRAQNSMKKNYNASKIERHLNYILRKEGEYLEGMDESEKEDAKGDERMLELKKHKKQYERLQKELESSGERQISTTDPDARALPLHRNIVEVGYNVHSAVDERHKLIASYEVTNKKDDDALSGMALKTKEALDLGEEDTLLVLADKGYHKGKELNACHEQGIETLVAVRERIKQHKKRHVTKDKFTYDKCTDTYKCPQGEELTKQARYARRKEGKLINYFNRYTLKHSICKHCPYHEDCVGERQRKASQGRYIDRSEYQDAIDKNGKAVKEGKELYRKRQAIVEHPFGTIKRNWGYTYTLLKTKEKVETEFSLIFLCYNLRRVMSILGQDGLKKALKVLISLILTLSVSLKAHRTRLLNQTPQPTGGMV